MKSGSWAKVCLFFICTLASCGGDDSSSDLKIVGGQSVGPALTIDGKSPDTDLNPNQYSVKLRDATGRNLCSGTLVLDGTYIITASHCIDPVSGITFAFFDQIDKSSSTNIKQLITTKIQGYGVINPGFMARQKADRVRSMNSLPTGDIALVKLFARPAEIPAFARPLQWATSSTKIELGIDIKTSGYGKTLQAAQGQEVSSDANRFVIKSALEQANKARPGPERIRLNRIIQTHLDELHRLSAPATGTLNSVILKLNDIKNKDAELIAGSPDHEWKSVCYGDSGGPSTTMINQKEILVGVNARVGSRRCIDKSKLVDIRQYNQWLNDFAIDQTANAADFFMNRNTLELGGSTLFVQVHKEKIK